MKSQVTLLLICTLFSKVLSQNCYECNSVFGQCEKHGLTASCSYQCLTATASVYMGGVKSDINMKSCSMADDLCVSGSMNLGVIKMLYNAKCCNTDVCNRETMPALPRQPSNGRKCYICDANSCSGTVSCEGNEDRCVTATVQQPGKGGQKGGNIITVKGCVSKSVCAPFGSNTTILDLLSLQCCEGNLCNAAESFTLSFTLMIVPLLSSILFY